MTGVVGIVSHKRDAQVSDGEIDDLTSAYESLRGVGARYAAAAGDFARVTKLAVQTDAAPRPAGGSSWTISCGTPHGAGSAGGTDLEALDGQFVWASYDADRDEFSVATDPFGMHALYLAERAGKIFLSTSALALARHLRARPSRLGLDVFLRAGYQLGSVTNWEGIERLDPGTRVSFRARGPERQVYWRPSFDEAVARLDLAGAVHHCRSVATDTYRAYYRPEGRRAWADLTGGYDSRLLTLLLREAGVDFDTNTIGREHDPDVLIAAQLASIAGWSWSRFELPTDWGEVLPKLIPLAVAWGDCHLDAVQLAEVLWGHIEKARVQASLLNGGGGEHFRNYAWQQEFLQGGRSNRVNYDNWADMRLLKTMNTQVFARDPTAEVRADLRTRTAAQAEPYSSQLNTVQLDIMDAYKSTGHFGTYLSAASGILPTELPFYLKPVFNAVFSTSHRHRSGHRLMRHMIEALDPRLAAVATTTGGPAQPPRPTNLHRFLPYYGTFGRKAVAKISQRLLPRPLLVPHAASDPVRAGALAALVVDLGEGRPLQQQAMRCGPLFKRDALNDLLSRAGEPGLQDAGLLCRILTVELALRAADSAVDA
jgi:Glutamine amidotransferase domain